MDPIVNSGPLLAETGLSEAIPIAALVILAIAGVALAIRRRRGE